MKFVTAENLLSCAWGFTPKRVSEKAGKYKYCLRLKQQVLTRNNNYVMQFYLKTVLLSFPVLLLLILLLFVHF